jgi:O-antigen ligase
VYVATFYIHPPSRWWGQGALEDVRWALIAAAITLFSVLIRRRQRQGPSLGSFSVVWFFVALVAWLGVQLAWAMSTGLQLELFSLYIKFCVVIYLIYHCIESERDLHTFLLAHVVGCFYLGWIAFTEYQTGRFEGFGGPGLGDANAAANQLVTGALTACALYLFGRWKEKSAMAVAALFILNALIATISRSGFLALAVGGLAFAYFAPTARRFAVIALAALGVIAFLWLTNDKYWDRMDSIKYTGAQVEGLDTGGGRVEVMQAQMQMFEDHRFGCGHRCTMILSPQYIEDRFLWGEGSERSRSSHNTFLTLMVEQGVPGVIFYVALLGWCANSLRRLRHALRSIGGLLPAVLPAIGASIVAIFMGDMFVDYIRHEARIWFVALILVIFKLADTKRGAVTGVVETVAKT